MASEWRAAASLEIGSKATTPALVVTKKPLWVSARNWNTPSAIRVVSKPA